MYTSHSDAYSQNKPSNCDCPSGTKWYPFNGCRETCSTAANDVLNAGWDFEYKPGGLSCAMGCEATGSGEFYILENGNRLGQLNSTGWACGAPKPSPPNASTVNDTTPDLDKSKAHPPGPKCTASEGVLTSSSGAVHCVPSGTPEAQTPIVKKETNTQVFDDTSTKITETITTKDPFTNAEVKTVVITVGPKTDGTAGDAGAPGVKNGPTTNSSTTVGTGGGGDGSGADTGGDGTDGDTGGDGGGGECVENPNSPLCKKGELKEKGSFGSQDDDIAAARAELLTLFNSVKSSALSTFGTNVSVGGGSLPCPSPIEVLGRPFSLCISKYSDELSVIGSYVVLAASLLAAFIIFRR